MKIVMDASTNDEHGQHVPGEEIDLPEDAALDYINRGLARAFKKDAAAHATGPAETAAGKGQTAGRAHATAPEKKDEK